MGNKERADFLLDLADSFLNSTSDFEEMDSAYIHRCVAGLLDCAKFLGGTPDGWDKGLLAQADRLKEKVEGPISFTDHAFANYRKEILDPAVHRVLFPRDWDKA